ncbi:MAG TPA: M17 family peptidase N-terminal domain-containing protein, partial [Gemmatimonadales bacterium]|nr:M17 family peptidase N-terminal domain-containing protein [Gemmatimonadales bacterium]
MPRRSDSVAPDYPTAPSLETALSADAPAGISTPFLAIAVAQGALPSSLQPLDQQAGGALSRLISSGDFQGKRDEVAAVYPGGPAARIVLIGLGSAESIDRVAVRRGAAVAAKRARAAGVAEAAFYLPPDARGSLAPAEAAQAITEGLFQGAWFFSAMKLPPEQPKATLERITVLAPEDRAAMEPGWQRGAAIGAGQAYARGLQVLPGNLCTPTFLAERASEQAARHGFECTLLGPTELAQEGMGALLAVAKGSAQEPRLIVLEYKGAPGAPVVLVGKGVTFDTGGISIKPAPNMEDMKYDMSGAAAVFGAFEMLGRLKPRVHVIGVVPSAENMPGGAAYRPGDVVKSHFGK